MLRWYLGRMRVLLLFGHAVLDMMPRGLREDYEKSVQLGAGTRV
jgi:hypothetical protein